MELSALEKAIIDRFINRDFQTNRMIHQLLSIVLNQDSLSVNKHIMHWSENPYSLLEWLYTCNYYTKSLFYGLLELPEDNDTYDFMCEHAIERRQYEQKGFKSDRLEKIARLRYEGYFGELKLSFHAT